MRRTITITLTEAQYHQLAHAVARLDCDYEDDGEFSDLGRRRALNNAWGQLNRAWFRAE